MDLHLIAFTISTFGTLFVGWAALRVHHRVLNEHQVDKAVFRIMRIEQKFGFSGLFLILFGYIIEVFLA